MNVIALLIGLLTTLSATDPEKEIEELRQKYPDETVVFTKKYEDYDIQKVGDSLVIRVKHLEEMAFLGDNVAPYTKDQVYTSSFSTAKNVVAKTLLPGRRKWEEVPVEEFRNVADGDNSVFFDDSEYISFTYPAVKKSTKTQLTYDVDINDPHFLGSDFFTSYAPVIDAKFTFTFDSDVKLRFKFFNVDEADIIKKEKTSGGRTTLTFQMKNVDKVDFEPASPSYNYLAAHMSSLIESYTNSKGETVRILGEPDDLYRWYWTFIDGLKDNESDQINQILSEIISPEDDELTKVKKIYYWVQENIKYIAFEDGMRGFIPHDGDYVCTKRYGDCKDMASIIVNMLGHAGIEAHYTWIGSRALPYRYTELPTASVDNHMIATYIRDGKYYFLDATGQYQPFGLPTSMIQGKEALIAFDKDKYEIREVPVIEKETNVMKDVFNYTIADGDIQGSGKVTLTGYAKVFNSFRMINSSKKATDEYINRLLNRGNNKFFSDHYQITGLKDLDAPITVDYDFRVEDYYREINGSIYFNMNLDKAFSNATLEEDRKHSKESDYKYINHSISTLTIPEGYEVATIPKNSAFDGGVFGYTMKYSQEGNTLKLDRSFYLDYILMQPEDFDNWNKAIEMFTKDNKQIVILKKK
jgi:hypothetical protein